MVPTSPHARDHESSKYPMVEEALGSNPVPGFGRGRNR